MRRAKKTRTTRKASRPSKPRRTAAQREATRKMLAARKAANPAQGKPIMARRRTFPAAPRRRRTFRRAGNPRRGAALVPMLAGGVIGAAAATGAGALTNALAEKFNVALPQAVKDYAPVAGAGVVALISWLTPKWRALVMPAVVGGVAVQALSSWLANRTAPAKGYYRLAGAGNVARTLNAPEGAGNVARVLNATAAA